MQPPTKTRFPPLAPKAPAPPLPEKIQELDKLASECRDLAFFQDSGQFARTFAIAAGIQKLRQALTADVLHHVMALQGNGLGFRTDKDKDGGYPVEVVRDCLIEATLRGAYPVNNEFNIISARAYLALNYYRRAMREFPGLSDVHLHPGVPIIMKEGAGALVPYSITAKLNGDWKRWDRQLSKLKREDGAEETIDERIPIRVNVGQGVDAILGKAERKMRAYVYGLLTGTEMTEGEVEDLAGIPGAKTVETGPPTGRVNLREPSKENGPAPTESLFPAEAEPAERQPGDEPREPEDQEPDIDTLAASYGQRMAGATTKKELEDLGAEITKARPYVGEEWWAKMLVTYQANFRRVTGQAKPAEK